MVRQAGPGGVPACPPHSRDSATISSTFSREATIPRSSTFLREATGRAQAVPQAVVWLWSGIPQIPDFVKATRLGSRPLSATPASENVHTLRGHPARYVDFPEPAITYGGDRSSLLYYASQPARIAKTGRRLRRNRRLPEKSNGLMAIYLDGVLPTCERACKAPL